MFHAYELCMSNQYLNYSNKIYFRHSFVNQFEKMDRSKPLSNHKDIVCGNPFEANDILQELSRLRNTPIELIKSKQEDAHELLCQLLSEIHDEICQILHNSNKNGRIFIKNTSKENDFFFF